VKGDWGARGARSLGGKLKKGAAEGIIEQGGDQCAGGGSAKDSKQGSPVRRQKRKPERRVEKEGSRFGTGVEIEGGGGKSGETGRRWKKGTFTLCGGRD